MRWTGARRPEPSDASGRPGSAARSPSSIGPVPDLKGRHFTKVADWSGEELLAVLDLADDLKARQHRREEHHLLPGRALGMIFQKPSTRTRVSFEVGIAQLGGTGLYLSAGDLQLGRGETLKDTATVLSRYLEIGRASCRERVENARIGVSS